MFPADDFPQLQVTSVANKPCPWCLNHSPEQKGLSEVSEHGAVLSGLVGDCWLRRFIGCPMLGALGNWKPGFLMQLRSENQTLNEKIQERNLELASLRKKLSAKVAVSPCAFVACAGSWFCTPGTACLNKMCTDAMPPRAGLQVHSNPCTPTLGAMLADAKKSTLLLSSYRTISKRKKRRKKIENEKEKKRKSFDVSESYCRN